MTAPSLRLAIVGLGRMGRAICRLVKPTLYDLFEMHAEGRAKRVVRSADKADTVFSMESGLTPFDANRIMSEFMA